MMRQSVMMMTAADDCNLCNFPLLSAKVFSLREVSLHCAATSLVRWTMWENKVRFFIFLLPNKCTKKHSFISSPVPSPS